MALQTIDWLWLLHPALAVAVIYPLEPAFWQSQFRSGIGLCGLLLFAMAAKPETQRRLRWQGCLERGCGLPRW